MSTNTRPVAPEVTLIVMTSTPPTMISVVVILIVEFHLGRYNVVLYSTLLWLTSPEYIIVKLFMPG